MIKHTSALYLSPLEEDKFYHVYNRANGSDKLFYNEENYRYFLRKYKYYLSNYVETYAYCLLPNHFHMLVKVKSEDAIFASAEVVPTDLQDPSELTVSTIVSEQYKRFFLSYAKSINKQEGRKGSLFMRPFKRIPIEDFTYLRNIVIYIHNNPVYHGIMQNTHQYPWSSYNDILSGSENELTNNEVLDWFFDRKNFIYCHKKKQEFKKMEKILIE